MISVIKMSKSNAEQVVLKKVQINSSGHYKCEVRPEICHPAHLIFLHPGDDQER